MCQMSSVVETGSNGGNVRGRLQEAGDGQSRWTVEIGSREPQRACTHLSS